MKPEIMKEVAAAKRSCTMCHTYRNFKPSDIEKKAARDLTNKAYETFKREFDDLRAENASNLELEKCRRNKTLCLDALDACDDCDREVPKIKEMLTDTE